MDPHRARLERRDPAELIGVQLATRGAERHGHGERRAADQPHARAPFEVGRDQERDSGAPLQRVQLRRDVQRRADRDDDPAHLEAVDPQRQPVELLALQRRVVAQQPGHHQLSHLLPHRQRSQQRIDG